MQLIAQHVRDVLVIFRGSNNTQYREPCKNLLKSWIFLKKLNPTLLRIILCRHQNQIPTSVDVEMKMIVNVDQDGRLWIGLCAKSAERGEQPTNRHTQIERLLLFVGHFCFKMQDFIHVRRSC